MKSDRAIFRWKKMHYSRVPRSDQLCRIKISKLIRKPLLSFAARVIYYFNLWEIQMNLETDFSRSGAI